MLGLAAVLSHPEAKAEPPNSPLAKLLFVLNHVDHINKTTMALALGSLGFLIFIRTVKPKLVVRPGAMWVRFVPEILLAVVIGTSASSQKYFHLRSSDEV
jgi:MFS superfamily sulfate permease-like transporter